MSTKSNDDLVTILKEKDAYTKEAIQAVTWELENRGLLEKPIVEKTNTSKGNELTESVILKEKIESNKSPFEKLEVPFLYSKSAILGFTIFFSTIFGAILLMQNLKEMHKPKEKNQVLVFGIVFTLFSTIILNYLPKSFFTTLFLNLIGYVILSEYFWNLHLGKYLKHRTKEIWIPLGISILIVLTLIFLLFLSQNLEQ